MSLKKVDLFPALIRVAPPESLEDFELLNPTGDAPKGTRKVDRCRMVLIEDTLFVAVDSQTGFDIVFREKILSHSVDNKIYHFLTVSGKIVAAQKDRNCGCGSRLRSWNPFGSDVFSDKDPQ